MPATLALPTTTTKTATKAAPLTAALAVVAAARAEAEASTAPELQRTGKALEVALLGLVQEVLAQDPQAGAAAKESAYLAERAHEAYLGGRLPLEKRNWYAARAAERRQVVLGRAQDLVDRVNRTGVYVPQSWVPELHRVA